MKTKANTRTIDMTRGAMAGPLIRFILPLIGSSIFQQLYNTVDFLFVGNLLNKTSAAAVGASSTLISCTIGMFSGISVGTSVVMAQGMGAGRKDDTEDAYHTSVLFGIIGGLVIMALGMVFAPGILTLLRTPESAMPEAVLYIRIYLLSLPTLIFYNMISGGMRSYGDTQGPFRVLVFCGIFNVFADWFFMVVVPLGVAGVAIATTLSQALSAVMAGYLASRESCPVKLQRDKLKVKLPVLRRVLRLGLPAGTQTILITVSNIVVQYYINEFGETAVAAFATYYKVENFIYLPIMSFGMAATTFAGQNYGAGEFKRIIRGELMITVFGSAVVGCLAGGILLFPRTVFTWFMKDQDVVTDALKIAFVSFPFYWVYPILEVLGGAVRGMGYALSSMLIIIFNMCLFRIVLLGIFSKTFHTLQSLASVYPITWAMAAVSFTVMFIFVMRKLMRENPAP